MELQQKMMKAMNDTRFWLDTHEGKNTFVLVVSRGEAAKACAKITIQSQIDLLSKLTYNTSIGAQMKRLRNELKQLEDERKSKRLDNQ